MRKHSNAIRDVSLREKLKGWRDEVGSEGRERQTRLSLSLSLNESYRIRRADEERREETNSTCN